MHDGEIKSYFFALLLYGFALLANDYEFVSTSHTLTIEGANPIHYRAITGKFPVDDNFQETEPPEIFFIAYLKENEFNRPITFVFPGGPGGSCGPESICCFGPRRILTPQEGKSLLPPYPLIDNPQSLLPWTDLVFVDPVGTGFSSIGENSEVLRELLSVDGDISALGDFIRMFISYFNRWNSPKYLSGTSYGTTRCCGIAHYLASHDLSLHGIILLGSALDYSTLVGQHNRLLPDSLMIPTFAASAWYHHRLWPDLPLEEVIDYARRFCFESYIPFMLEPHRFGKGEQEAFYQHLAMLIGLPLETVRRYQGRFDEFLYTTEFFAADKKILGGLDTRYVGERGEVHRKNISDDPSYKEMQGIDCAFNAYLRNELKTDPPFENYVSFSSPAHSSWDYATNDSIEWPELIQRVRKTLIQNPQMKIFIGSGYYDCRTPFAATEYCFDHLNLPLSYRDNLIFQYYEGGHGFIFDLPSLKKLKKDLVKFYDADLDWLKQ